MADVDCIAAQRGPFNFIADIYDCALDPHRWNALLCKASQLVRGCAEFGTFQPEDVAAIAALTPHFRRAATMASLLGFKSITDENCLDVFNGAPVAIVLTDGRGCILDVNEAGQRMLDGCALLCLDDELAARDRASDIALRAAIVRAGRMHRQPSQRIELTSILVKGVGGVSPFAVWVMPISENLGFSISGSAKARVAIFACPMRSAEGLPSETFVRHHSIAAGDGRLLALLAKGLTPDEAASALAISMAGA